MLMKRQKTLPLVDRAWRYDDSISGFFSSEIPLGKRKVTISTPLVHPVKIRKPRNQSITRLNQCPGQGLIYENIYKQLKFEYIYNILKYSILKLYAMKCILSVFSCFAKMRTRCGHESIAVFESKSYLCRA